MGDNLAERIHDCVLNHCLKYRIAVLLSITESACKRVVSNHGTGLLDWIDGLD